MIEDPREIRRQVMKGRGAVSNDSGRYEAYQRVATDDGWPGDNWPGDGEDAPPARLRTQITPDRARKVITRNRSPDVPFDRSINPYRGCEHGCVYCFARPTHAWLGLSPGLDFETKLFAKHEAADLLRHELRRPGYEPRVIALGTNTDPYQPIERRLAITRRVLEVLAEARHPVSIVTKSDLILRDLDILAPMAEQGLAKAYLSVTSLERDLARRMEPRAPTPQRRLAAIDALHAAGVPVGVLTAPLIPALNDSELERILAAAAARGAGSAGYVLLRLPLEIKDLFNEWLEAHFPDRKARILKLVRETRGGALYDPTWNKRQTGEGHFAKLLADRFELACRRLGLQQREWKLRRDLFRPPLGEPRQFDLFQPPNPGERRNAG